MTRIPAEVDVNTQSILRGGGGGAAEIAPATKLAFFKFHSPAIKLILPLGEVE